MWGKNSGSKWDVETALWCVHTSRHPDRYRICCTELCGCVHSAQRQTPTQILISFCVNSLVSVAVSVSVSVAVSGSVNAP